MQSKHGGIVVMVIVLPLALVAVLNGSLFGGAVINSAGASCADPGSGQPAPGSDSHGVPSNYLTLYQVAGTDYGIPWNIIAAIGKVESDHGRSNLPGVKHGENDHGAGGPMQFLAPTWRAYGVDGDRDGDRDRYDPADAIPGAATYLKARGAPQKMRQAIFAYNHANWYVDKVLAQAARYGSGSYVTDPGNPRPGNPAPCSLPGSGGLLPPKGKDEHGNWPPEAIGPDGVTARMRQVCDLVKQYFHPQYTVGCLRPGDPLDHGKGRACDFMLSTGGQMPSSTEVQRGFDIANWAAANAAQYGIRYVIYRQHIWNIEKASQGWRLMADRGSITDNHFDHPHISVN